MPKPTKLASDFSSPKVMGILNTTPDSFSDGGKFMDVNTAFEQIEKMVQSGAEIIDIGGESTRPGSEPVSVEEELNRVIPVFESAIPAFKQTLFSVDTTKYEVARKALELGVSIVNDVSAMKDLRLLDLAAQFDSTYVIMHSQGDPKIMQQNPRYENVVDDLKVFFEQKIEEALSHSVSKIILDPGIGFGKTLEHNLKLISNLDHFTKFGYPLLIGASRKSMIGKILGNRPVEERLPGTIAVHYHTLMKGANILRVHDVKEASDSIRIFNAVQSQL